jgi:alkanesulfonate monooxygenase SsuD/methylene tetrahydromethanopterin reductase-like flavin-dependent oxidoreductase (luciferase family)
VKRFTLDEGLDIVRRLWKGETVTFKSDHYDLRDVAINVRPQQADVPVYIASLRPDVAYYVGKGGNNIMTVPYATVDRFEQIKTMMDEFKRGVSESPKAEGKSLVALHTWIADSDDAARAEAKEAFDLYVATRKYAKSQTYDDIIASGLSLFGSVETVVDKVVALHGMGVDHIMTLHNFGDVAPDMAARSITRFAQEVMPRVNERLGATVTA